MDNLIYNTLSVSGGASKCIASIGSVFYLHEKGHLDFIRNYIGTSAGSIICYLLVIGYSPLEIIHFLCSSNFIDEFQNLNLAGLLDQKGLINFYVVQDYLEKLSINKIGIIPTFRELRTRFGRNLTAVTYNMTKNKVEYLNFETYPDMNCLTALRMSMNVPLLFERFFYNGCEYLDGGLVENFPINYYNRPENHIIGINTNPYDTTIARKQNYVSYLLKIAMIPYTFFNSLKKQPDKNCTIIGITSDINTFDFNIPISKRLNLFSKGYQSAKKVFEPEKEPEVVVNDIVKETEISIEEPEKEPEVSVEEPMKEPEVSLEEPMKEPEVSLEEPMKEPVEEPEVSVKEL